MIKVMKWLLCFTFLLASLPMASLVNAETAQKGQSLPIEQIDSYIREQFTEAAFPGGAYAVFEQGKIVLSNGIGYSDKTTKQAATENTVYSIASITKVLTAAAIHKLAEEDLLDLDAPVNSYLPWFHYKDVERSEKVTVRHLLTHSAGVSRYVADGAIYKDIKNNRNSLENAAKSLQTVNMNNEPGSVGQYCNTCYNLLGLIIETVTNEDYEAYMEQQWFDKINMNHTTFAPYNMPDADVAKEYGYLFGFQRQVKPYWEEFGASQAPEGGAYSSAIDLATWAIHIMDVSSPQVFETGVNASDLSDTIYTESGFERHVISENAVLIKSGDGMGSSSYMALIPDLQSGFVLLVGEADGETTKTIGEGIIQLMLGMQAKSVKGSLNVMKTLGFISLFIFLLSLLLITLLLRSIFRLSHTQFKIKRRWTVILRLLLFSLLAIPFWLLLIKVRPTEAGFYGYPYDLAAAMIAFAVTTSLWALYSAVSLLLRRTN